MKKYNMSDIRKVVEDLGLDPFPVDFHIVPADVLYDIAGRAMPGRYSHWSHGKQFYDGITRHDYRFGRVYELVINSEPCQAFLLDVNSEIINLMVKAHVYGHSDVFKNNREFKGTDRQMHLNAPKRAERVRQYEEEYGEDKVREVLDAALTVEFYVSQDKRYIPKLSEDEDHEKYSKHMEYDDVLELGSKCKRKEKSYEEKMRFAGLPTDDILGFLIQEAPVEDWKKDLMSIVRSDGIYFSPQMKTKIVNEGWASMIHQKIMRTLDIKDSDYFDYAETNAGVVSAGKGYLNPYWLGLQIFRDIEKRHGFEKCLEARKYETDSTFLRNYLTEDLVNDLELIRFGETDTHYIVAENEWEKIRDGLINDLTDRFPSVSIIDRDYNNGGLLLKHNFYGTKLKKVDAIEVLTQLRKEFWKNDVYLKTKDDKEKDLEWKAKPK